MKRVLILGAAAVAVVVLCGGGWFYAWGSEQTRTCTVTDKDRSTTTDADGNPKSIHRIYTEECGVMEAGDVWVRGVVDSADVYASLEAGEQYEITTVGWRIPFFSAFPKIIEVTEVE